MKTISGTVVLAVVLAITYGVIFSLAYPLVTIDGDVVSLMALLGLATSLLVVGIYKRSTRSKPDGSAGK